MEKELGETSQMPFNLEPTSSFYTAKRIPTLNQKLAPFLLGEAFPNFENDLLKSV